MNLEKLLRRAEQARRLMGAIETMAASKEAHDEIKRAKESLGDAKDACVSLWEIIRSAD